MSTLSSRSLGILTAVLAVGLLAFATPAQAQVLDAEIDVAAKDAVGLAMPGGDPAMIPITITYTCGGLSGDGTIAATASADVSGASASPVPATFTAQAPPDCTLSSQAAPVHGNISVSATKEVLAGTEIPVDVVVTGANALGTDQTSETKTFTAMAGPYIEVTFNPTASTFEVPAGERTTVTIEIVSASNVMVMGMPAFVMPEGWEKPAQPPQNVESPLAEGGNGTGAFEFEVLVPSGADPGEYEMEFVTYAHTMGDVGPTLQTDNQTFPLTFTVTEGSGGGDGGDSEEGPGPSPFMLAVLGAALLTFLRRRE